MSADNYTTCPKCAAQAQRTFEKEVSATDAALEVAFEARDRDEYDRLTSIKSRQAVSNPGTTLREYYEIHGAETGIVQIDYSCSCSKCGLRAAFTHSNPI